VYCLLGLTFDAIDLTEAEHRIRSSARHRTPCFLSTPNLNFLVVCQTDVAFRDSVINSDLNLADGMPIVWLSRLLGIPIHERVAGATLFERLRQSTNEKLSVYFFGGPDGVAEAACKQLNVENKGMTCVGYASPGFGSVEDLSSDEIIRRINASNADFLVVALGARKGQAWIEHNRHRLNTPIISHLGAVVNFVAGTVTRAPAWLQKIGLEWLWRIKEEPTLWKRYAQDGVDLLALLATCVIPYALFLWCHDRKYRKPEMSIVATDVTENSYILRPCGHWTKDNIAVMRNHFMSAVATDKDILVDMQKVSYVDSAFIGLLMLVNAEQTKNQKGMTISGTQKLTRQIFQYCRADSLLAN